MMSTVKSYMVDIFFAAPISVMDESLRVLTQVGLPNTFITVKLSCRKSYFGPTTTEFIHSSLNSGLPLLVIVF